MYAKGKMFHRSVLFANGLFPAPAFQRPLPPLCPFQTKICVPQEGELFLRLKDEFQFSAGSNEDKVHNRKVASNKMLGGQFIALAK